MAAAEHDRERDEGVGGRRCARGVRRGLSQSRRGCAGTSRRKGREPWRPGTTPRHTDSYSTGCNTRSPPARCVPSPASTSTVRSSCRPSSERRLSLPRFPPSRVRCARTTRRLVPLRTDGSIFTAGRFAPYKGVDVLCAALDAYWRAGGDRAFEVVGQGKVPSSLRRLETSWPTWVRITNEYVSATALHHALGRGGRVRHAVPERHSVRLAVVGTDAWRAPDRDRRRMHRELGAPT